MTNEKGTDAAGEAAPFKAYQRDNQIFSPRYCCRVHVYFLKWELQFWNATDGKRGRISNYGIRLKYAKYF